MSSRGVLSHLLSHRDSVDDSIDLGYRSPTCLSPNMKLDEFFKMQGMIINIKMIIIDNNYNHILYNYI